MEIIKKLLLLVSLSISIEAENKFILNKGIVDIGTKVFSMEHEVPKEIIQSTPILNSIDNITNYLERKKFQKIDCEMDYLGTVLCPSDIQECPTVEEYDNGFSIPHTTIKHFVKVCPEGTIKENEKCYIDANMDGTKDPYFYSKTGGYLWKNHFLSGTNIKKKEASVRIGAYGYMEVRHYSPFACDDDQNQVVVKVNGTEVKNVFCGASKDTGTFVAYENNTNSAKTINYLLSDQHFGRGWDNSYMLQYIYQLNKTVPQGYFHEKINGITYFYKNSTCPSETTIQADNSCKMEYQWYEYKCSEELNIYGIPWIVLDKGADCGNPKCTNAPVSPLKNCARATYKCPIDPSIKCGKTILSSTSCKPGYTWNNARCERDETYCGNFTYSVHKDICEDISYYVKKCTNANDLYIKEIDKCTSTINICANGSYDTETGRCTMFYEPTCVNQLYAYDYNSQTCINKKQKICDNSNYVYDKIENICKGTMHVCDTGFTYDEISKKCEKQRCGILNTVDQNGQCEYDTGCRGTITAQGNCIPDEVQ